MEKKNNSFSVFEDIETNNINQPINTNKSKPKEKEIIGKTQTVNLNIYKKSSLKPKFSLTINYLDKDVKENFNLLSKKTGLNKNSLLKYLVEKELTKYQGK